MAGTILSGTYSTGIVLKSPTTQRTIAVTGSIANVNGDAIYGPPLFPWRLDNSGTISSTGTAGYGVHLTAGGVVNNSAGRLIGGYGGVRIGRAAGVVSNLGTIRGSGANGRGVRLTQGGRVTNGSAAVTTALIAGEENGIVIENAAGTVGNFGTIKNTEAGHSAIVLFMGGSIANGSAASIAGSSGGIYARGGFASVTNFGSISGGNGMKLTAGGRVTNGQSGSLAGHITGTFSYGVAIWGAAGTVANFGTIRATGAGPGVSAVLLNAGGIVTNGASGATTAAISGSAGVYVGGAAGTVRNFGLIEATSTIRGNGVVLRAGGLLANFGTIRSSSATNAGVYVGEAAVVTNGGAAATAASISGGSSGIIFRNVAGSVVNFGTVAGRAADGVYLQLGGRVTNQTSGLITGIAYGIGFTNGGGVITNLGTVQATAVTGKGVGLLDGGSITNGKSGSAAGSITGVAAGVYLRGLGGSVTNFGTIRGATGFLATGRRSNTLVNWGTVASTSTAAGAVAVSMGGTIGNNLLVVERGAVFRGLVLGGGKGEIEFVPSGTAGMAGVSGFATVALANGGAHSLSLTNANFAGVVAGRITVIGGNAGNTVNASTVTGGSVTIEGGIGKDILTGGTGGDFFVFTAAALKATDRVKGGGGPDRLQVTTAGTVVAGGVTAVEAYQLANGGVNTLVIKNANFSGIRGGDIFVYGGSGGNTIDGAAVSAAADKLVVYGGAGHDVVKGGAGDDIFSFTAAGLAASDSVNGGKGKDELLLTTAGTLHVDGVSGVESIVLADGGASTLTLKSGNFAGVPAGVISISDGDGGTTVSASALPAADRVVVFAGAGTDKLTGGAGPDVFDAGGKTTMTGKGGADQFTFSAPGSNTVADFSAAADKIVVSNSGFGLGLLGLGDTPSLLPASFFTKNSTGAFTNTAQRFAYDTTHGKLFFSASGTTAGEKLVATLTGHPGLDHLFVIGGPGGGSG